MCVFLKIGELIKSARTERGLTQEELGRLVGVQKSAVAKWENGRVSEIKRSKLNRLTKALNLSPTLLLECEDTRSNVKKVSSFAERLRMAMEFTGKRQIDLSSETGIDKGSMSNYLSGRYEPKQEAVHLLAGALDVPDMWLLGYAVPPTPSVRKKSSDAIPDITARLQADSNFLRVVKWLYGLDKKKLEGLLILIR